MEKSELIKVILTSSLIAGILSAIVSALVSIKLKNLDYKNEYYKKILEKRLEAYGFLETQIAVLKSTVIGKDGKAYYMIFDDGEDKFYEYQQNLFAAMSYSMWIHDDTIVYMEKLNELFFKISKKVNGKKEEEIAETGKNYYNDIFELRKDLENSVRKDLLNLHNLKKFKKSANSRKLRKIELEK